MENTTSGTAPLAVKFTDTSTNSPTSWLWKFGDGTTSTIQNPAYTYTTPGTYTVNVTATNVGGSNLSASQTITVTRSGPTASFIENVTIGTAPLAIQFTDTSTNSPTSWYWVFGDGSTSPVQNATHIFSVPGTYQVNLTAFNAGGESTSSLQMITVTRSGPTASFIENTTTGVSPLTVQFTDTSTNSPTSWYWVFGDGSTSPVQNASHTFATPGTYQVNLTVSNTGGKSTSTLQVITVIPSGTTASFVANPTSGTVPLAVQFNDTSSNSPTSWYWVFGDGNTSIVRNATHTFTTPGTYQVNLTASNAGDKSTSPLQTITVTQSGPTASFVANPTSGTAPLAVQFTDTSTDSPTSWFWVFGDGSTSTVQNVTHTFAVPGTYQVNLTISNAGGKSTSALQAITVTKSVPTPVLTITGIDPTTWTNNVAVPVTITGTGFNTTTKPAVILTQTGYGNITLSGISASSGESLIGIVPAGISPGVWNVVVINPSGQEATNASVQYTATTTTPTQTPTPIVTQHHGSPYNGGGGGNSQTGNTGGTGTGSSKSGVGKSENKYQLAPPESPTSAPITPIQPIPTVSNPTLVTMVLLTLQEYQFWLILGVIIIILIAILRRWWIRRQNPLLFRKFD
jgi:PKD repeat protein